MTAKKSPTGPPVWTLVDQQIDGPNLEGEITFHLAFGVTDGRVFFVSVSGLGDSPREDFVKAAQSSVLALSNLATPPNRVH